MSRDLVWLAYAIAWWTVWAGGLLWLAQYAARA